MMEEKSKAEGGDRDRKKPISEQEWHEKEDRGKYDGLEDRIEEEAEEAALYEVNE